MKKNQTVAYMLLKIKLRTVVVGIQYNDFVGLIAVVESPSQLWSHFR